MDDTTDDSFRSLQSMMMLLVSNTVLLSTLEIEGQSQLMRVSFGLKPPARIKTDLCDCFIHQLW